MIANVANGRPPVGPRHVVRVRFCGARSKNAAGFGSRSCVGRCNRTVSHTRHLVRRSCVHREPDPLPRYRRCLYQSNHLACAWPCQLECHARTPLLARVYRPYTQSCTWWAQHAVYGCSIAKANLCEEVCQGMRPCTVTVLTGPATARSTSLHRGVAA